MIRRRRFIAENKDGSIRSYLVYIDGRIWSCYFNKFIEPKPDKHGYKNLAVYKDGKRIRRKVHHIVLEVFGKKRKLGQVCRHLDGDRTNNALSNLEWGTYAENEADKLLHGTDNHVGSNNPVALLSDNKVRVIRKAWSKSSLGKNKFCEIYAAKYNVSACTIKDVTLGNTWKHVT